MFLQSCYATNSLFGEFKLATTLWRIMRWKKKKFQLDRLKMTGSSYHKIYHRFTDLTHIGLWISGLSCLARIRLCRPQTTGILSLKALR